MDYRQEIAARAALAEAGIAATEQARILRSLMLRLDPESARRRRDYWIRAAYRALGNAPGTARVLSRTLANFQSHTWPRVRHLAAMPPTESDLRRAMFEVLRAVVDASGDPSAEPPGERQIRRIVSGHRHDAMSGALMDHDVVTTQMRN